MLRRHLLLAFIFISHHCFSQDSIPRPKLIVGIVVDQMRDDFLWRYYNNYSDEGFKLLLKEGFQARNHQYSYAPTYTGPGHASIYTGTTPAVHGIIANDWYDRRTKDEINCTSDSTVTIIGEDSLQGASPHRLMTTTITDELRLSTNFRSKVIGISLKDRGAILPAGHIANAAYWFTDNGNFVSSSFYMDSLPNWVQSFNESGKAESYLKNWNLFAPIEAYAQSMTEDDNVYEGHFNGESKSSFPHDLAALQKENNNFEVINYSPFGNALVFDFGKEAIAAEQLGSGTDTDFLTLSLSSPDYVGHRYGIRSLEIQDTYLRLDNQIADFIAYLDGKFGRENYLLFLTSDHGAAENPQYLMDNNIPGGYINYHKTRKNLSNYLKSQFNCKENLVADISNYQIYLNEENIKQLGLNEDEVAEEAASFIQAQPGVYACYPTKSILFGSHDGWPLEQLYLGIYPKRSGDVIMVLQSGWFGKRAHGTTHGSIFRYDRHVPLFLFGWNIEPATSTFRPTAVEDLAVTLALMLHINEPSGSTGKPIMEVLTPGAN